MAGGRATGKRGVVLVPATPARAPLVIAGLDPAIPIGSDRWRVGMAGSRPAMTRTNLLCAPHLRDHRLDMIDRRLRDDPVAEVEDVRAAAGGAQDRVDAVPERIAAGDERQRIEVALRREPLRKLRQEQVR